MTLEFLRGRERLAHLDLRSLTAVGYTAVSLARPLPFKSRYNSQRVPTRGAPMPVYDYICNDCKKSFETVLTLAEHDKERISCPHCRSKNVEQEAAAFFAVTGKKS